MHRPRSVIVQIVMQRAITLSKLEIVDKRHVVHQVQTVEDVVVALGGDTRRSRQLSPRTCDLKTAKAHIVGLNQSIFHDVL